MPQEQKPTTTNPDENCDACPPGARGAGPPREAGGTTGEGNLAPMQANRTGGATGGVSTQADAEADRPARAGTVPPDA